MVDNPQKIHPYTSFEDLLPDMLACAQCRLRSTCQQVVPGEGNIHADILFIGEGPGQKEDQLGRPFVGAAGKFLDTMLASISLRREDIYIANTVKCRPPQNRDPLPDEKETCRLWLNEQIRLINPKVIVTLGKHALATFLPESFLISQCHGKPYRANIPDIGKRVIFALYHPAAALYNGGMRETLLRDFARIPMVVEKVKQEK